MNIKILVNKISNSRQDAFWYQGRREIAILSEGDKQVIISIYGKTRIKLPSEDIFRKNGQALDNAFINDLDDTDLQNCEIDENNWFDFFYIKGYSKYEIMSDECFYYDNAIQNAIDAINDDTFWKQF